MNKYLSRGREKRRLKYSPFVCQLLSTPVAFRTFHTIIANEGNI